MPKRTQGPATAVGISARAELAFAVIRDGVTVDRFAVAVPDGANLYSPADLRRWLAQVERQVAKKIAELNVA